MSSLLDGLLLDPYRDPREVWIALRTDGAKGCGTQSDPYDASTDALFDNLMLNMPAYTTVHLGPGVFKTKGFQAQSTPAGWQPKSGQKILGAGMGVTTLQLVGASTTDRHYVAIGIQYDVLLEDFEVSDLTVDCNIAGQPNQFVSCAAIGLPGRHIRIRRVRAINFSSQTTAPMYVENFVISSGATHPTVLEQQGREGENCIIEDCIVERPGANPVHNSFCLHFGFGERPSDGVASYARGCAIRNCLVNTQIVYGTLVPLPIKQIGYDSATDIVTVTSKAPHLLTKPGNLVLRGVMAGGSFNNPFNGVFEIEAVISSTVVTFKLDTNLGLDFATDNGFIGGGVSTHPVSISGIVPVPGDTTGRKFKITTREPHGRTKNNNVRIAGVGITNATEPVAYNGSFPVLDYDPAMPNEIQVVLSATPETTDPSRIVLDAAFMSPGHIGLGGDAGPGAMVEGNRVYHCSTGGPYNDTGSSKDLVARDNYYHDVVTGPSHKLSGISTTNDQIPLLSLDHDGLTAIATTDFPHGFVTNDRVTISGVTGQDAGLYNGLQVIKSVLDPKEFRYDLPQAPSGPASDVPGYFTYEIEDFVTVVNQRRLDSLTKSVSNGKYFARAKQATYVKNGLEVGHWVRISKAGHAYYNGAKEITAVSDPAQATPSNPQTFEYELQGDPGIDSSNANFSAGYFGRIWQTRRLVIENNAIDLGIRPLAGDYGHHAGMYYEGTNAYYPPAHSFLHFVIRGNIFRDINDSSVPSTRAIEVYGCQKPIIEHNIIGVDPDQAITHSQDGEVRTFNNLTPAGALVPSVALDSPPTPVTEVSSKVRAELEEAMVMSLMEL